MTTLSRFLWLPLALTTVAILVWAVMLGGDRRTTIWLTREAYYGVAAFAIVVFVAYLIAIARRKGSDRTEGKESSSLGGRAVFIGRKCMEIAFVGATPAFLAIAVLNPIAQRLGGELVTAEAVVVAELERRRFRESCERRVQLEFADGRDGWICYWPRGGHSMIEGWRKLSPGQRVEVKYLSNCIGATVVEVIPNRRSIHIDSTHF